MRSWERDNDVVLLASVSRVMKKSWSIMLIIFSSFLIFMPRVVKTLIVVRQLLIGCRVQSPARLNFSFLCLGKRQAN